MSEEKKDIDLIRHDISVANNERLRRRRQRRNRAIRNSIGKAYRHNTQEEHKLQGIEEEEEVAGFSDILSDDVIRYCNAVVNPFGNDSVGALLPDNYQELVVPLTDRLELDITPDIFNYPGSGANWQDPANNTQLTGIFIWFQPRCIGGGLIANQEGTSIVFNKNPWITVDDQLSASDPLTITNAYNLCIAGIWEQSTPFNQPITFGLFNGVPASGSWIINNYIAINYTRFDNILNNCDKLRILGAGIKVLPEQAPINTGGYGKGGWITLEDVMSAVNMVEAGPLNAGALKNIQPSIKYAYTAKGLQGVTVRYSTLQSQEQVQAEYPQIPLRLVVPETPVNPAAWSPSIISEINSVDLGISDLIEPGSFVPCIYWSFNTTDQQDNNGVYTLKIVSTVHSEGTPTGQCPFQTNKSEKDPAIDHVKLMLENPGVFPAASKGNSFKSFMKKTRHVMTKFGKYASKTGKLISLVDKFFE
jgi:hypothetical protein